MSMGAQILAIIKRKLRSYSLENEVMQVTYVLS